MDTSKLSPDLLARVAKVLAAMEALGFPMRICQGFRTAEEQHELWRQGRDIPGPDVSADYPMGRTVTQCDGYKILSNHQSGKAIDCCFVGADPWNKLGPKQLWEIYGMMGMAVGLYWGGYFPKVDQPHLELR